MDGGVGYCEATGLAGRDFSYTAHLVQCGPLEWDVVPLKSGPVTLQSCTLHWFPLPQDSVLRWPSG